MEAVNHILSLPLCRGKFEIIEKEEVKEIVPKKKVSKLQEEV